jgi:hypothetical protein
MRPPPPAALAAAGRNRRRLLPARIRPGNRPYSPTDAPLFAPVLSLAANPSRLRPIWLGCRHGASAVTPPAATTTPFTLSDVFNLQHHLLPHAFPTANPSLVAWARRSCFGRLPLLIYGKPAFWSSTLRPRSSSWCASAGTMG